MTKTELVDVIWEKIPINRRSKLQKRWVKFIIDEVFETIKEASILGEAVSIHKFGKFTVSPLRGRRIFSKYAGGYTKSRDTLRIKFKPGSYWKKLLDRSM